MDMLCMEMERSRTRSPMAAGSLSTSTWISWGLKALRKAWAGGGGGGGRVVVVVVEEEEEEEDEEVEEERVSLLMLWPVEERRWCCCWCWFEGRVGEEVEAGRRGSVVWGGGLRWTWETRAASCCASSGGRAAREVAGLGVVLSVVMVVSEAGRGKGWEAAVARNDDAAA